MVETVFVTFLFMELFNPNGTWSLHHQAACDNNTKSYSANDFLIITRTDENSSPATGGCECDLMTTGNLTIYFNMQQQYPHQFNMAHQGNNTRPVNSSQWIKLISNQFFGHGTALVLFIQGIENVTLTCFKKTSVPGQVQDSTRNVFPTEKDTSKKLFVAGLVLLSLGICALIISLVLISLRKRYKKKCADEMEMNEFQQDTYECIDTQPDIEKDAPSKSSRASRLHLNLRHENTSGNMQHDSTSDDEADPSCSQSEQDLTEAADELYEMIADVSPALPPLAELSPYSSLPKPEIDLRKPYIQATNGRFRAFSTPKLDIPTAGALDGSQHVYAGASDGSQHVYAGASDGSQHVYAHLSRNGRSRSDKVDTQCDDFLMDARRRQTAGDFVTAETDSATALYNYVDRSNIDKCTTNPNNNSNVTDHVTDLYSCLTDSATSGDANFGYTNNTNNAVIRLGSEQTVKFPVIIQLKSCDNHHANPNTALHKADGSPAYTNCTKNMTDAGQTCPGQEHMKDTGHTCPGQEHMKDTGQTCPGQEHMKDTGQTCPGQEHMKDTGQTCPGQEDMTDAGQTCPGQEDMTDTGQTCPGQEHMKDTGQTCPGQEDMTDTGQTYPGQQDITDTGQTWSGQEDMTDTGQTCPGQEDMTDTGQTWSGQEDMTDTGQTWPGQQDMTDTGQTCPGQQDMTDTGQTCPGQEDMTDTGQTCPGQEDMTDTGQTCPGQEDMTDTGQTCPGQEDMTDTGQTCPGQEHDLFCNDQTCLNNYPH